MFVQNIHILSIIAPLLMGFFSFLLKDRYLKAINILFLSLLFFIFFFLLYSVFNLNLLNGKTYNIVIGGWSKSMGIELKYNINCVLTLLFLFLISIIFFANTWRGEVNYAFRGFVFMMLCGANGMIITNDIFNTYVFFEIVCITTYIMYAHGENIVCLKNSYNYMIISCFAGVIFLLVACFLYQITGNLNIDLINKALANYYNSKSVSAIFVFFILAMMFKLGLYPLHNILQNIYQNLSLKYLLFVAGISSIVYPYFIMKFVVNLFGVNVLMNNEYLNISLKVLGGVGFIFFNYLALSTNSVLYFIIFLSFAQTSLFAFCIQYLTDKIVINGINFAITSHTLIKVCMFAILYKIQKTLGILEINKSMLASISSRVYRYLFVLLLFLISGMPFSLVFMSKWYILVGIFNTASGLIWLSIIVIGFAIDIFACFMFMKQVLIKKDDKNLVVKEDWILVSCIIFAILVLIISGFFVGSFKFSV